jgi:hypothetical protein
MLYSGPNSGKTHLLGTAGFDERTAPMFLIDFEGGTKTLDGMPGFHKLASITDNIPSDATVVSFRARNWEDFNEGFERCRVNDDGFKSAALDSASEVHNFAIEAILEEEEDNRKDPDSVQQQDYGKALIQLRRLVREFRDLPTPMHFFCTAHSKEVTHPQRGMILVPNMYGKGAFEIPGLLETVGYIALMQADADDVKRLEGVKEGEEYRSLLLRNYPKLDLKVRTAWGVTAPEEIDQPTVTKLLDALGYAF